MKLRYIIRELRAYPRYSLLFIFNIFVGMVGLASLQTYRAVIEQEVLSTSQSYAGGDLIVSSRVEIQPQDLERIEQVLSKEGLSFEKGEVEELFTMAAASGRSRLIQIKAQDSILPFYGAIGLGEKGSFVGGETWDLGEDNKVWVYPEILNQLQLEVGDKIHLGGREFEISAVVTGDSVTQVGRGALAPRVYMSRRALRDTGLIQKGSTLTYRKIYKLPEDVDLEELEEKIQQVLPDPAIQVRTHINVSEANARMVTYLGDYMGLIALIALLLSALGTVYLYDSHLSDRLKDLTILKVLGMKWGQLYSLCLQQAFLLAAVGSLLALIVSYFLFPLVDISLKELLPFSLQAHLNMQTVLTVLLVGTGGALLSVWPLIRKLKFLSASELFQESGGLGSIRIRPKDLWAWLPYATFFYALAAWQAHSFIKAGLFLGLILISALSMYFLIWTGLKALLYLKTKNFEAQYAFRELARRPADTITSFVALCLGILLASLIFVVESSLRSEFDFGDSDQRPSLFLFDIQDEQLANLERRLQEKQHPLQNVSPLVRARLISINGEPYQKEEGNPETREGEVRQRRRDRGFNLSERMSLSPSETVIEGRYFKEPYISSQGLPEISVEENYANSLGFKVGDILNFDVMGVSVEGKIVGFRRVKWASFQPNFFVQFQGGVFEDFPKTHVASIGNMSSEEALRTQNQLVDEFPNISIIDVGQVVDKLLELSEKMAWALKAMAALVLAASVSVVLSIQAFHIQRKAGERSLLHLLGLARFRIRRIESIEIWVLSFSAVSLGWLLSYLIAWPVTHLLFERLPSFSWGSLLIFIVLSPSLLKLGLFFIPVQERRREEP